MRILQIIKTAIEQLPWNISLCGRANISPSYMEFSKDDRQS